MAAIETAFVQVQLPSSTGVTVDATVSGFGAPSGAIFFGITGTGVNGNIGGIRGSVGFWGINNGGNGGDVVSSFSMDDNAGTSNTRSKYGFDAVQVIRPSSGSVDADYVASPITDGIRLTAWVGTPQALGSGRSVGVILFKNCTIRAHRLDNFTSTDKTIAYTEGQPKIVLFSTVDTAQSGDALAAAFHTFGVAVKTDSGFKQACHAAEQPDAQGETKGRRLSRSTTAVASRVANSSGNVSEWDLELTGFTADGYTLSPTANMGGTDVIAFAIFPDDADQLYDLVDVDYIANTDPVISGLSFQPNQVLSGGGSTGGNVGIAAADACDHYWFFNDSGDAYSIAYQNSYGVVETQARVTHRGDGSVWVGRDGTQHAAYSGPIFNSDGWEFASNANWTNNWFQWALVLGDQADQVGGGIDVDGSAASIGVTAHPGSMSLGTSLEAALAEIDVVALPGSVQLGTDIGAQIHEIEVLASPGVVSMGTALNAPVTSIEVTVHPGSVTSGSSITAAVQSIEVQALAGQVGAGASIAAAVQQIEVLPHAGDLALGATIQAALADIGVSTHPGSVELGDVITPVAQQIDVEAHPGTVELSIAVQGSLHEIGVEALAASVGLGEYIEAVAQQIELTPHGATLTLGTSIAAEAAQIEVTTFEGVVEAGVPPITALGLEYTIPTQRLHFTMPVSRIHWTFTDEDR